MIMEGVNDGNSANSATLYFNGHFSALSLGEAGTPEEPSLHVRKSSVEPKISESISPLQSELHPPSQYAPPVVNLDDGGNTPPEQAQCTNVYVANLPPTADATKIRELFCSVGKVLHVKVLLDIATGVSRGIAFVMFEDLTTARKACVLKNKVVLDGAVLQVRLAERSALHSSVETHVRSCIVYIRNVPGSVPKDQVKAYCSSHYGRVLDVVPHPQSCEQNGPSPFNMVFVTFDDVDHACRCVEGIDGKAPFGLPQPSHPFTMAKMINDIGGEMRKSILLRRRSTDPQNSPNPLGLGVVQKPPQNHQVVHHHPSNGGFQQQHHPPQYVQISPHGYSLLPNGTPHQSPSNASLTPHRADLQQPFAVQQPPPMYAYGQSPPQFYAVPPSQTTFASQPMHTGPQAPQQFVLDAPPPRRDSGNQQQPTMYFSPQATASQAGSNSGGVVYSGHQAFSGSPATTGLSPNQHLLTPQHQMLHSGMPASNNHHHPQQQPQQIVYVSLPTHAQQHQQHQQHLQQPPSQQHYFVMGSQQYTN